MSKAPFEDRLKKLAAAIQKERPTLVKRMGALAIVFIHENFEKQGFQGATLQLWTGRKDEKDAGRPILQGKGTAHLKRSPFVSFSDADKAIITSSLPYSKIHNEGGIIHHPARDAYMSFDSMPAKGLWRLGKVQTIGQIKKIKATIPVTIGAHDTHMPKRQYMGHSPVLVARIKPMLQKEIGRLFHIVR